MKRTIAVGSNQPESHNVMIGHCGNSIDQLYLALNDWLTFNTVSNDDVIVIYLSTPGIQTVASENGIQSFEIDPCDYSKETHDRLADSICNSVTNIKQLEYSGFACYQLAKSTPADVVVYDLSGNLNQLEWITAYEG